MDYTITYNTLKGWVEWLLSYPMVKVLVGQILLNVVVAVAATIYTGEFRLGKLWQFLYKKVLPLLLVYGAAIVAGDAAGMGWLKDAVWVLLTGALLADLGENLKKLGILSPNGWKFLGK